MELFTQIAEFGKQIIQFSWLPLAIWTFLTGLVWMVIRMASNIHPQYQYHTRLALLFALPAGFAALILVYLTENILFPTPEESLKIISVVAPFELSVNASPVQSSPFATTSILHFSVIILLCSGLFLFAIRNLAQWLQLTRLKKGCKFMPIQKISGLDSYNLDLITQSGKNIQIAFQDRELVPVTFGVKHPVILIPDSIKSDPEKLNLVLRHELTHISHNDFVFNVVITFTQTLFWFHPFVHFLKRELIDYREMRCDSIVLAQSSVSKKKYASLLLELLPMPNIHKEFSVNMAQESSNLKKRIHMITQQKPNRPVPRRSSLAIFAFVILSTAIAMSCTDMQTNKVFDEEELDLMTDVDQTGERGYHQILIFMGEEGQDERHRETLSKLDQIQPEYIQSIDVLKGEKALEVYGSRASNGVIVINTHPDEESYNTALQALGMETQDITSPPSKPFFVVVEEMPELIGGLEQLQSKINYPEQARQAGIEGRVYLQFIVDEQGEVENPRVIRGIGGGANEEALRVVRQAKFKPGYQRGKAVRVQYSLPFFFRLNGNETSSNSLKPGDNEMTIIRDETDQPIIGNPEVDYNTMEIDIDRSGASIEGTVTDSESGKPLAGANVFIQGTNLGTATDSNGRFSIPDENAEVSQVVVSYVGYRTAHTNL